jgi:ABC-type uncharacterized transport system permease subunit
VLVALISTVLSVMLTSMAGWALVRYQFRGKILVTALIFGTMTLPYFVVVVPQFIMVARDLGLSNTWVALIVPPLFNSLGVLFMRQAFSMMPRELFDAAQIEGVKEWQIFTRVALPLAKPTLAALAIILSLPRGTTTSGRCSSPRTDDDDRAGCAWHAHRREQGVLGFDHDRRGIADPAHGDCLHLPPALLHGRHHHRGREMRANSQAPEGQDGTEN